MRRILPTALVAAFLLVVALPARAAPGDLDPTFGGTGFAKVRFGEGSAVSEAVLVQPDGRIVLVGTLYPEGEGPKVAVARFLADGTLDEVFGRHGRITARGGAALDVALQADGKIVVAYWSISNKTLQNRFALLRLEADGARDATFGNGGRVAIPFGDRNAISWSVAVTPGGKIVAAGQVVSADGNVQRLGVARYRAGGALDTTFSGNGLAQVSTATGRDVAWDVAVQDDGKIVAVGGSDSSALAVRLNADGTLDTSFAGDGVYEDAGLLDLRGVVIDPGGNVVAAGGDAVIRLTPSGAPDKGFGGDGDVATGGFNTSVVLDPDGRILVGGGAALGGGLQLHLSRLLADGTPDPAFGDGGSVTGFPVNGTTEAEGVAVQADGKPVVAVYRSRFPRRYRMIVARYEA